MTCHRQYKHWCILKERWTKTSQPKRWFGLRITTIHFFFLLGSSSEAESETSILQSDDETEVTAEGLSRTPDLRVCPLR